MTFDYHPVLIMFKIAFYGLSVFYSVNLWYTIKLYINYNGSVLGQKAIKRIIYKLLLIWFVITAIASTLYGIR